jgi:hypothetical protein
MGIQTANNRIKHLQALSDWPEQLKIKVIFPDDIGDEGEDEDK